MNRRQFLTTTAAAGAAAVLSACNGGRAPNSVSSATTRPVGANDDIRVAVVGFHSHGKSHIRAYQKMPGVRLVALCDVDERVLQTQADLLAKDNVRVKTYRDIRALLDSREVDAISCAMTNRWHSLAAVWGCQAGKDVCVEKPVSHCIWEGRKAVEAARKYRRVVQADLDNRSRPALDAAFAYVQSGQLWKIAHARAWDYKRRETMGKLTGPQTIPATVDYNLWTGPAPLLPLMREKFHYDWHWQWHTGSGEIANNGSHQLDQIRWALGNRDLPRTVTSFGGRFGYVDDGQTPNTMVAVYDFDGIPVVYENRGLPAHGGGSIMSDFEGETAGGKPVRFRAGENAHSGIAIFCEGGYYHDAAVFDNDGNEIRRFDAPGASNAPERRRPQPNFIHAVRTRDTADLKTDIEQGHRSAATSHMGNVSYLCGGPTTFDDARKRLGPNAHASKALARMIEHLKANKLDPTNTPLTLGPVLTMDAKAERFTGDHAERANLFVKDAYRAPFVIPDRV